VFTDENFESSAMTDRPDKSKELGSSMVQSTVASPTTDASHVAETTACIVAGSSHGLDVMSSTASSSIGVVHTTSLVVGPSDNVVTTDGYCHRPAVPTPELVRPFPKAPERRGTIRGGNTGNTRERLD
jgi:hypothetical protein